jgi:hypothetical protein
MTRYRVDAKSAAVGIPLTVYLTALSLLALWLYALLQPRQFSNPGLAAYTPPPGTVVIDVMPARLVAQHWQAPPPAEIESRAEEPKTTVVESKPKPTIEVKEPKRPKARDRDNPLNHYAASYRGYGSSRYSGNLAAAYPGYSGNRPF